VFPLCNFLISTTPLPRSDGVRCNTLILQAFFDLENGNQELKSDLRTSTSTPRCKLMSATSLYIFRACLFVWLLVDRNGVVVFSLQPVGYRREQEGRGTTCPAAYTRPSGRSMLGS
jgi:hypothetical protein